MESRRRGFAAMGKDCGTREIFDFERASLFTFFPKEGSAIFQIKWR